MTKVDITLLVKGYIADIKYLERPQEFANTTDGSSELEMEMRRYAPKFLKKELDGYHWEVELTNIGVIIKGFGYTELIKDELVDKYPDFKISKEVEE